MSDAHQALATLAGFMLFFAAANWVAGGNNRWRKRFRWPGRSIYYAGLAAIVVGWLTYGGLGALIGASFTVWRLPGWYGSLDAGTMPIPAEKPGQGKIFGIELQPYRLRDYIVMSARGLLAFPAFVYVAWRDQTATPLVVLAVACLMVGAMYDLAHHYLARRNDWAEAGVGAVWGMAFFMLAGGVR